VAGGGHSARAYNPFDAVYRFVVAFEMRACEKLADQTHCQDLQPE